MGDEERGRHRPKQSATQSPMSQLPSNPPNTVEIHREGIERKRRDNQRERERARKRERQTEGETKRSTSKKQRKEYTEEGRGRG